MKYTQEFYVRLLLDIEGKTITPIMRQSITHRFDELDTDGATKSLLPRVVRALSGNCCVDDKLKSGSGRGFVKLVRAAALEINPNKVLGEVTYTRTNGTKGHKKLGTLDGSCDSHNSVITIPELSGEFPTPPVAPKEPPVRPLRDNPSDHLSSIDEVINSWQPTPTKPSRAELFTISIMDKIHYILDYIHTKIDNLIGGKL